MTLPRALLTATATILPLQAAMGVITVTQWAHGHYDIPMFLLAAGLSASAAYLLTCWFQRL